MQRLPNPQHATHWCQSQRNAGRSIGYVATMGALHDGHIALLRQALDENDVCCVSIFVNPLQFNDAADFERYPRDLQSDYRLLEQYGVDMVFVGSLQDFFPEAADSSDIVTLDPGIYAEGLEGTFRPGHLAGVRTIADRLFKTIGQCRAYFGEKDFQQTLVIKDLAAQLGYPDIIVCPTVRESSGLALSSRNALLSSEQRQLAACLHAALLTARRAWQQGVRDPKRLQNLMWPMLDQPGVEVDYAEVRDPGAWTKNPPHGPLQSAQALIAVRIGAVRLIDNMSLTEI
ncbi:MAG: pantoate--beta-alanine ligase [Gammaproteobacteria bacterium]|nr:pantoate--beta-alanine ligase [Gammaproteobacteria bacterium]MDH3469065.1 pantoate--beta-alanine ligase [Gammaproteobacteria bacterium]